MVSNNTQVGGETNISVDFKFNNSYESLCPHCGLILYRLEQGEKDVNITAHPGNPNTECEQKPYIDGNELESDEGLLYKNTVDAVIFEENCINCCNDYYLLTAYIASEPVYNVNGTFLVLSDLNAGVVTLCSSSYGYLLIHTEVEVEKDTGEVQKVPLIKEYNIGLF